MNKSINIVFDTDMEGITDIRLPAQIFVNKGFKFLLTIGGCLVNDEQEYTKLMTALKGIGETRLNLVEHKMSEIKTPPFVGKLSMGSDYDTFQKMECRFDPIFKCTMGDFFVYGNNPNWGIYLSESPSINIIGCIEEYLPVFRAVFGITSNGLIDLDDFINREYPRNSNFKDILIKNYHLQNI